ncbi:MULTISPECIES: hypothetical protein [unclassified Agromyces]|uniref:hypothetical protein n=1 Tax=unclassified Agromyces TaxID=2639701 RepID=UPI0030149406
MPKTVAGHLIAMWLARSNSTLTTGGSVGVSIVLALLTAVAFVVGILLGRRFPLDAPEHDEVVEATAADRG